MHAVCGDDVQMGVEVESRAPSFGEVDDAGLWVFVLGYGGEVVVVVLDLVGDDLMDGTKEVCFGINPVTKRVGEGDDELPKVNYGTFSTKWYAASAILLPVPLGQKLRLLHEKAVIFFYLQSSPFRRRKPWAKMPYFS